MLDGLIIDSFAGGGGASCGIEMALGRSPDIAINHNAEALCMHAANHPKTVHLSKNIWKVDPLEYVGKQKVDLAWFSPDCKHFSKAKGGKPVAQNIRDLAWVVVLWARQVRPAVIMLENVEEFRTWGPLDENSMPCSERKGQTFDRWVRELRKLGYRVEWKELRACDFGAPTITQQGSQQNLVAAHMLHMKGAAQSSRSASDPLAAVTAQGLHHAEVRAFLMKYYGNEKEGHDLAAPIGTVTTKDRFGLVMVHGEPYQIVDIGMRRLSPRELFRAQGFPDSYIIDPVWNGKTMTKSSQVRMCGNSVSPVMSRALVSSNFATAQERIAT